MNVPPMIAYEIARQHQVDLLVAADHHRIAQQYKSARRRANRRNAVGRRPHHATRSLIRGLRERLVDFSAP